MSESNESFFQGPPKTMFLFGLVTGVAIAAILYAFFFAGPNAGGTRTANTNTPTVADTTVPTVPAPTIAREPAQVTNDDWVRGDLKKAKVVLVEYSDFECPFCGRHHPTMQSLMNTYGDDIAWVYRHFPLSFHPQAMPAALASECVGEQLGDDGFWAFGDRLFENQTTLGTALYEQVAGELGANMDQYRGCVSSGKYNTKIASQQAEGSSAGVQGTPATFVNGQLVSGAVPLAQIQAVVEASL